jgi:hypothetical protein
MAVIIGAGLYAQSLSIPASTVKRGASASLLLTLDSPAGKSPVALQWKFIFPENVIVDRADIVAGSAAESAQKSLTCAGQKGVKQPPKEATYACILAGGQQLIPKGTIAVVRYRVALDVLQVPAKVRVEDIMGVTADLEKIEIPNALGAITVK